MQTDPLPDATRAARDFVGAHRLRVPRKLFEGSFGGAGGPSFVGGRNDYDSTADGQRFLFRSVPTDSGINIVLNWTADLENDAWTRRPAADHRRPQLSRGAPKIPAGITPGACFCRT